MLPLRSRRRLRELQSNNLGRVDRKIMRAIPHHLNLWNMKRVA
jgi:hypothetical protein